MSERALRIGIDGREMQGHPTGVGRYLRSLLRRFGTHDTHRFVVFSAEPVELPLPSTAIGCRVLPGGHPLMWEQRVLPAAVAADGIDVLLSPAYSCPIFCEVPRVTAIHDLSFFALPGEFGFAHGLRRRVMARASARVSKAILACSEFTRGEVRRHLGEAAAAKTAVVLLGPDDDLPAGPSRAESRAALHLAEDETYIVTVGTILRRRNVGALVRGLASLRSTHPRVRLGIVGDNRSHPFEDITALARVRNIADRVTITGFVSDADVARHYAAADIAVFLSDYEGFGLPALEAMARAVPTIVADRGSLNEISGPGALRVEPEAAAVADALRRVIEQPALRAALRTRGEERARSFSWERTAAETLRVLETAAS